MNNTPSNPTIQKTTKFSLLPVPKIPGLPSITSGGTLINDNTIIRPTELVVGLLHKATKCVLASGSKAGKTWLLLYMALCVATGRMFLRWSTTRGKVLFVNLEIQTAFIKERLTTLMQRLGITDSGDLDFLNWRGRSGDSEALIANLIKETEGKGYSLIIIDPYYKLMNGKSENTAGSVATFCHQLERLAERSGAAVVYSHHFAKGNAKKKSAMDRMSGSGVFARDADTVITLTEHTEANCYTVEMILRNLPSQPSLVVQWDYPVMVEREDLEPEDLVDEGVDDGSDHGVLALLDAGPLRSGEWEVQSIALGISRATFHRVKKALREGNHIIFDRSTRMFSSVVSAIAVPPPSSPAPLTELNRRPAQARAAVTEARQPERTRADSGARDLAPDF